MKISKVKSIIIYEVATHGVATHKAVFLYCSNRMSKKTFDELVKIGKEKYKLKN